MEMSDFESRVKAVAEALSRIEGAKPLDPRGPPRKILEAFEAKPTRFGNRITEAGDNPRWLMFWADAERNVVAFDALTSQSDRR